LSAFERFRITSVGSTEFTDRDISWVSGRVTGFSPNDISGLRRPKNVEFGTKVVSSTRVMLALGFLEKVF